MYYEFEGCIPTPPHLQTTIEQQQHQHSLFAINKNTINDESKIQLNDGHGHGPDDRLRISNQINLIDGQKQKLVDLTHRKLKTLACGGSNGDRQNELRNKVLLETALKKILDDNRFNDQNDNDNAENHVPFHPLRRTASSPVLFSIHQNNDQLDCQITCSNISLDMAVCSSDSLPTIVSPRKRRPTDCTSIVESNEWKTTVKRLKIFHSSTQLDPSNVNNMITAGSNEEVFSDLASFFHRLKTQQ